MDKRNAFGFLALGTAMGLLPALAPAWFPPEFGGMDAQAMWLVGMGTVQIGFGSAVAFQGYVLPWLARRSAAHRPAEAGAAPRRAGYGWTASPRA
jgi:hypothetical protein